MTAAEPLAITTKEFDIAKHDCTVTITSPKTGDHRTFRIRTVRKGNLQGKRILEIMIATGNWESFAFVDVQPVTEQPVVNVWKTYRGDIGVESIWQKYASMIRLTAYWAGKGVEYQFSLRCRRCGRVLTHPRSITTGIGPDCETKEFGGGL